MGKEIQKREAATGHSVCSPSQLYRILACPASYMESVKAPLQPQSSYAARGTMLHDITARLLEGKTTGRLRMSRLDIEDRNQIEECLDYANEIRRRTPNGEEGIEQSIDLKSWGLAEVWGTSDFSRKFAKTIHIVDWKFGSGVQVYAEENEQLLAYAAGVVGYPSNITDVVIHVVQPAISFFDVWAVSYKRLSEWVFDVLTPGLEKANSPEADYNPGEKQCRFCPAGMTCRARHKSALKAAAEVFRVYSAIPQVTPKELAQALEKIQEIQTYAQQVQKFAEQELLHGRPFPGYKLVSGRSIRRWENEKKAELWLLGNSAIPQNKLYAKKFISPAQAEKLDRILKKTPDFEKLITKPEGKPQLVKEDDPRPAMEPNLEAAKAFEGYDNEEI